MEFDKEYNQFLQDLQQYPNYFQMETEKCSSNIWKKIAKKIEDEKEELLEFSDLVRIKNQNLEACASYYLGDVNKAQQIISKVLKDTNSSSINACAMIAILNYRKGEIIQAKKHLSRIKVLADNAYNIDVAKSEVAYAYRRLDAKFYKKAIVLYTEVVERNPKNIPWKFGLAIIYRRCLNTTIHAMFPKLEIKTCFKEARKNLTYVLENCTDEKDCYFKANSYIELADLYTLANATDIINTDKEDIIDIVNQGVRCLPKNTTVLTQAGKILRHCFKFKEAEELLQNAYKICPNSYICHQLGLIQKNRIIHQHRKSLGSLFRDQWNQDEDTLDDQHNSQQLLVKALDDPSKTIGGPTILPNESKTEKKQAETLSNVSLTNTIEAGKEQPLLVSSWQTSTIKKSDLQNNPVVKMARLINSPGYETYDFELSRKLEPCLDLFKQSAQLGQEQNMAVYYDWGITLLQMIPSKFDEVMEKFNHILEKDSSQFMRYRCYEQYGICFIHMSESQDFDKISRENYRQNAKEMFQKAICCWAYCQKINLSKHFDNAVGNCNSLISIRDIILGEDEEHGTKPKKDMASLYYLVKQYGLSLSLYQEVYDKLQRTSDTDTDVIKGIINNHLQLQQYTGVLDLLALLLCSKEGLQCLEFKTDVLTKMINYAIDKDDFQLSESVFKFEKDPNEEIDNYVVIIFNEEDQVTKTKGATLQNWLSTFSKSGLKVIKITETAVNLPRLQEQTKLIYNCKMAIFILANETPSTELTYFTEIALKAQLDNNSFLKKIFPIVINNGMVPDIFKTFRSMKITHQPNTSNDQDKSEFLKTFSKIFLEKPT